MGLPDQCENNFTLVMSLQTFGQVGPAWNIGFLCLQIMLVNLDTKLAGNAFKNGENRWPIRFGSMNWSLALPISQTELSFEP